ncbi:MAG: hypothetical protein R3314_07690 [Longimicrobiales bacterium]|nr:hypothetical protein [Longimicrobiales bacterium]
MYTTTAPRVRDRPAAYGPHEVDADPFPAARVLDDLAHADEAGIPQVLARYAALRAWLIRHDDPGLVRHARQTARAYLAHVGHGPDTLGLTGLADGVLDADAMRRAASSARRMGHREGAFALLQATYLEARHGADLESACGAASEIAGLLRAEGLDGAELWARRSARLSVRLRRRPDG